MSGAYLKNQRYAFFLESEGHAKFPFGDLETGYLGRHALSLNGRDCLDRIVAGSRGIFIEEVFTAERVLGESAGSRSREKCLI